jgi:hypothetical protein
MGGEATTFDHGVNVLKVVQKALVKRACVLSSHGLCKFRASPLASRTVEGELAYDKDTSFDVLHGAIHFARCIGKDPKGAELFCEPGDLGAIILLMNP